MAETGKSNLVRGPWGVSEQETPASHAHGLSASLSTTREKGSPDHRQWTYDDIALSPALTQAGRALSSLTRSLLWLSCLVSKVSSQMPSLASSPVR